MKTCEGWIWVGITMTAICDISVSEGAPNTHQTAEMPAGAEIVIFESGRFAEELLLELPTDISAEELASYKQRMQDTSVLMPPLPPSNGLLVTRYGRDIQSPPPLSSVRSPEMSKLIECLEQSKNWEGMPYATTEWVDVFFKGKPRGGTAQFQDKEIFFTYTPRIDEVTLMRDGQRFLKVGRYRLRTITYTNAFKVNPMGMGETDAFAVTFIYAIEKGPFLPALEKTFEGKAIAVLDPTDGKWKLDTLQMPDRGPYEYLDQEFLERFWESLLPR